MSNRYLRASGNWNGPVWAATSGGAAGSASTPTASDSVYIAANFNVTLTADASCESLTHTNGTISLSSYVLEITGLSFISSGSTARTINLGNGTLKISVAGDGDGLQLSGTNLTLNAGKSLVYIVTDTIDTAGVFDTLSKNFNDVRISCGEGGDLSTTLNITGSPTFRSLTIQSKNSAAHTVQFDGSGSSMNVDKLIVIGSSSANKLTLATASGDHYVGVSSTGSSYGQFVGMSNVWSALGSNYIGSNSTDNTSSWLLQDPPKISTLVDPLTTAPGSNPNWRLTGTLGQRTDGSGGGGYAGNRLEADNYLMSTDTFDLVDSSLVIERPPWDGLAPTAANTFVGGYFSSSGASVDSSYGSELLALSGNGEDLSKLRPNKEIGSYISLFTYPTTVSMFIKLEISGGKFIRSVSADGVSWEQKQSVDITNDELPLFRSVRISSRFDGPGGTNSLGIGSINMLPRPKVTGNFLPFFIP